MNSHKVVFFRGLLRMETGSKGGGKHSPFLDPSPFPWPLLDNLGEEVTTFVHSPSFQVSSLHGVPQSGLYWQIWLNDDQIKSEKSFSVLKVSIL